MTLLFTDIEGSTQLLQQLGDRYPGVLADHRRLLRAAFEQHGGVEVDTQGDSFFIVFGQPLNGLFAATAAQQALATHGWPDGAAVRVRMGLHCGEPTLTGGAYVGIDVHRAARLCAAGHGGQVLVSQTARDAIQLQLQARLSLRSLGVHRLKDLQAPEEIFQLVSDQLASEFPPLRTVDSYRNNLPSQSTPLVGREQELKEIHQRLLRPEVRLLTLTGPGGTGKTRLALQLAAEVLDQFGDGASWVALAGVGDPALVASAIAQSLGIRESAGQPLIGTLKEYLWDKELLLCLDNFEHLLPAATIVSELLASCQQLKVLVTSRAVLHVYGEHDFAVPPLGLPTRDRTPSLENLAEFEAVRLFVERAQAVKSDFAVTERTAPAVVEICQRLDGLPLGIELAAARVRLLPPEAMLVRMERRLPLLTGGPRDMPYRHQTLRGAIAWSYDLLGEDEQALFRRLPVFAGGCTLDAAEIICGTPDNGVLDRVASLLDKSLLREQPSVAGEPRLLMLETIREYGLEQLEASGEAAELRRRHAHYYLQLAEMAEPGLHGPDQVSWLDRLEAEHDNLGTVQAWTVNEVRGADQALRFASALLWFWLVRGYYAEGRRALEAALALPANSPPTLRPKGLRALAHLTQYQGDLARSIVLLEEAIALDRASGDTRGLAMSLSLLGESARFARDFPRAEALLTEALTLHRQHSDDWARYHTLYRLAETFADQRQYEQATVLHEESLAMRRSARDTRAIAAAVKCLGLLALAGGDYDRASRTLQEGVATYSATRDKQGIANCLEGLAAVAIARGALDEAARLLGAVDALLELVGGQVSWRARFERDVAAVAERMPAARFAHAWDAGRAMTLDDMIAHALAADSAAMR